MTFTPTWITQKKEKWRISTVTINITTVLYEEQQQLVSEVAS